MPTCPFSARSLGLRLVVSVPILVCVPRMITGCASPGPPRPPSLQLPEKPAQLSAERVGDVVHIAWTTPFKTTDHERIRGPVTAVICRALPPSRNCIPVSTLRVAPGPGVAADTLPAALTSGPTRSLQYQVELFNAHGRSAGPSNPLLTAAGSAPDPMGTIRLTPRRGEILVRWQPEPRFVPVQLERTLLTPPPAFGTPRQTRPATEVTLRQPASETRDAGGLADPTVGDGQTYSYIAQRVEQIQLDGKQITLRGLPSPAATVTFHAIFPPTTPTGLVAAPGAGFGSLVSVDLSWEPSPGTDQDTEPVRYNVYRRTPQSAFVRLTPAPVETPAFHDPQVQSGKTYIYRVTAVDTRGNESAPGQEIQETPRQ